MKRRKTKILVCCVLILTQIVTVMSNVVPVVALSASGLQTTIASIIVSLMVQAGAAPVSNTFVNSINTSYGVESSIGTIQDCIASGLLTESGGTLVDTGLSTAIESAPAFTELGLGDIFATTIDDVGTTVATGGSNLAQTAINAGTIGTIGAYAGAASIGVGIGVLANKIYEKYKANVINNIPLNLELDPKLNGYPYQAVCTYVTNQSGNPVRTYNFAGNEPIYQVWYTKGAAVYHINPRSTKQNYVYTWKEANGDWKSISSREIAKNNYSAFAFSYVPTNPKTKASGTQFATKAEAEAYVNNVLNGTVQLETEPSSDFIGINGNLTYDPETETIPGLGEVNPNGYDMNPIPMDVYQNYVENANGNTENGDTGITQAEEFGDLIDSYIITPSVIPDQGIDEPDYPEGGGVVPDQPTVPDKPEVDGDDASTVLGSTVPADIRSVFPFCIPFDLFEIVKVFRTEDRVAPHITFEFPGTDWTIDVDLSPYDSVAGLLRTLELMIFIVGLAVASRKLIGAGGS